MKRLLPLLLPLAATACSESGVVAVSPELFIANALDFRAVTAGGRAVLPIEAKNVGSGALELEVVDYTDSTPFSLERRSYLIAPNGTAEIPVTFAPLEPRDETWSIVVQMTSSDPDRPELEVTVTGQAVFQVLSFDPDPVRIGPVLVGGTWRGTVDITNTTEDDLVLAGRVTGERHAIVHDRGEGRFSLEGDLAQAGSSTPIAAGETVSVNLLYQAPAASETTDARMDFTYCGGAECIDNVRLIAEVTDIPFVCSPPELNFGFLAPDEIATRTSSCTNISDRSVGIDSVEIVLGGDTFDGTTEIPSAPVEPGGVLVVGAEARPDASLLGEQVSATMRIVPRDFTLEHTVLPVTVRVGAPRLEVAPTSIDMGIVVVGTSATRDIVIANDGEWPVELTPMQSGDGEFAVEEVPTLVGPGERRRITVTFTPSGAGFFDASIRLLSNGVLDELLIVASGEGLAGPPCGQVEVASDVELGLVQLNRPKVYPVRVVNRGTADCLVGTPHMDPTSDDSITLLGSPTGRVVPPGEALAFDVMFSPTTPGERTAELRFYVSVAGDTTRVVTLSGEGVTDAMLVAPSEVRFGTVAPTCSTNQIPIRAYNPIGPPRRISRVELLAEATTFTLSGLPPQQDVAEGAFENTGVGYRPSGQTIDAGYLHLYEAGRNRPYVVPIRGLGGTADVEERYDRRVNQKVDVVVVLPPDPAGLGNDPSYLNRMRSLYVALEDSRADFHLVAIHPWLRHPMGNCSMYTAQRPAGLEEGRCAYFQEGGITGMPRPDWRIITPNTTPDGLTAFERMLEPLGNQADAFETLFRALSPPLELGWNAGFLRPDAHLAVVLVTSLDDTSTGWVPRDLELYRDFLARTKAHAGPNRVSVSAVSAQTCSQTITTPRLNRMADELGGVVQAVCSQNDWGSAIGNTGLSILGNRSRFALTQRPDASGVLVEVDGSAFRDFTFDPTTNVVTFADGRVPDRNAEIVFRYRPACP